MSIIDKFSVIILILILFVGTVKIHAQSDWQYDAAIYGWFAGMEGTIGIANHDEQFQATLSDLLKNLTFTAGGHFEAINPKLSLILDVFYVGLKEDVAAKNAGNTTIIPNASIELNEWIIEGAIGYRAVPELEVLLATRVFAMNADLLNGNQTLGSNNKTWAAIYLGARYTKEFDKKWYAALRGDIGYGGNAFTWFVNAAVGYRFSELFSLALAYRILNMEYEDGAGIKYFKFDGTTSGFGLAAVFSF
jgi:hypothetical protein